MGSAAQMCTSWNGFFHQKTIKNQWFFNDFAKIGPQNGVGKGLKVALVFGLLFGAQLGPPNPLIHGTWQAQAECA